MGDSRPHLAAVPIYLADIFFRLAPREHDLMPAALAAQLEIHPHPQDQPPLAATGMGLLHFQDVIDMDIPSCPVLF